MSFSLTLPWDRGRHKAVQGRGIPKMFHHICRLLRILPAGTLVGLSLSWKHRPGMGAQRETLTPYILLRHCIYKCWRTTRLLWMATKQKKFTHLHDKKSPKEFNVDIIYTYTL